MRTLAPGSEIHIRLCTPRRSSVFWDPTRGPDRAAVRAARMRRWREAPAHAVVHYGAAEGEPGCGPEDGDAVAGVLCDVADQMEEGLEHMRHWGVCSDTSSSSESSAEEGEPRGPPGGPTGGPPGGLPGDGDGAGHHGGPWDRLDVPGLGHFVLNPLTGSIGAHCHRHGPLCRINKVAHKRPLGYFLAWLHHGHSSKFLEGPTGSGPHKESRTKTNEAPLVFANRSRLRREAASQARFRRFFEWERHWASATDAGLDPADEPRIVR